MDYSAFISYKHAEQDSAVAAEVQRRLERFHVPKEIEKKTGKKKIGSIFRDREELPITSDLNQTISDALNHSEYLIVICSTRTKESYWVPREIDYFLQTHSKDRVLTVLVDGEPFDVIPEVLLTDTVSRTAPDGTEYFETRKREPLSGDFRNGIRRSRKTEIPRLAAALLGCSYDELVMREHQYRRRRRTLIFSIAAALMLTAVTYLLWSRHEIQKNYELAEKNLQQARVNQSMYLSSESGELLQKGYRIRAIQLAMEAMPRDGDRPYVPEALEALSLALHTYLAPESRSYYDVCDTVAELRTKGKIEDFFVSPDNKYICAIDTTDRIYLWDSDTGKEVLRLLAVSRPHSEGSAEDPLSEEAAPAGPDVSDVSPAGEETDGDSVPSGAASVIEVPAHEVLGAAILPSGRALILLTDSGIVSYGIPDGKMLWKYEDSKLRWNEYSTTFCVKEDDRVFLAAERKGDEEFSFSSGKIAAVALNGADGKELLRWEEQVVPEDELASPEKCRVSDNGQRMAVAVSVSEGRDQVLCFDLKDGSCSKMDLPPESGNVHDLCFIDDTHLSVMAFPEWDGQVTQYGSSAIGGIRLIEDMDIQVGAYDAGSGDCLWAEQYVNSRLDRSYQSGAHKMGAVTAAVKDGKKERFVYSVYANQLNIYYAENGKKYKEVEFEGEIIKVGQMQKGGLKALLANGNVGSVSFGENSLVGETTWFDFENEGTDWIRGGRYDRYVLKADDRCLFISEPVYDTACNILSGESLPKDAIIKAHDVVDDHLMLMDFDAGVHIYDLAGEKPLLSLVLGEEAFSYDYIGKDEEEGILWFVESYNREYPFIGISVRDGKKTLVPQPGDEGSSYRSYSDSNAVCRNGKFGLVSYDRIETASVQDGKLVIEDSIELDKSPESCFFSPSFSRALETVKDEESGGSAVFLIDLKSGDRYQSEACPLNRIRGASWDEKEEICAFSDGQTVFMTGKDGKMILEMNNLEGSVVSLQIHDDILFVLCSGGNLLRYNLRSGDMLGRTDISNYTGDTSWQETEWVFREDDLILVTKDGLGDMVRVLETDTFKETAVSPDAQEYDFLRDRMICIGENRATGETKIVWYPRYSPEDLMKKAGEALKGAVLSDEDRVLYGLEKMPLSDEDRAPYDLEKTPDNAD